MDRVDFRWCSHGEDVSTVNAWGLGREEQA